MPRWDRLHSTLLQLISALSRAPYYWCHLSLQPQAFPLSFPQITRAEAWVGLPSPCKCTYLPTHVRVLSFLPDNQAFRQAIPPLSHFQKWHFLLLARQGWPTEGAGHVFIEGDEQSAAGHSTYRRHFALWGSRVTKFSAVIHCNHNPG